MSIDDYLKERVEDQIDWYSKKSSIGKKFYIRIRTIEIIFGFSISLISLFLKRDLSGVAIGALSFSLAGLNSFLLLNKYQENWLQYRSTSELLKQEKYMFIGKSGTYNTEEEGERFKLFVERCETIISSENINWAQYNNEKSCS